MRLTVFLHLVRVRALRFGWLLQRLRQLVLGAVVGDFFVGRFFHLQLTFSTRANSIFELLLQLLLLYRLENHLSLALNGGLLAGFLGQVDRLRRQVQV